MELHLNHPTQTCPTASPRPKRAAQPIEVLKVREALLMKPTVSLVTGLSASSISRKVASGDFPAPIKHGPRCTRWVCGAVLDWLAAQAAN